ncbi:MAG: sigma-54 dependent transcriptional regulator [Gammaproteobacteria bacterium]|nr:sigma-54 dependent transcriptional regulator [Gammaproteobacteria bacterium]
MTSVDRDVVALLDDALHTKLLGYLQARGWKLHRAANADELADLIEQRDFHAGLLQLQRVGNHKLFDLVGRQQSLQWIALMDHSFWNPTPQHRNFLAGVYDFHTLPVDQERLAISLGHAWGKGQLLRKPPAQPDSMEHHGIVGSSPAMQAFSQALRKASKVDAPVLIGGESGTGKELAAHAIHNMSARSRHAFVAVNCGALPTHLIQSELFGHEKGAFTGAYQRKIGRMEAAQGGTLFLDEIADLPLDLQANLLRVLQDKVIERLGSSQPIQLDIRVIAATHIKLREAVAKGHFREDLYYRLNVINLQAPPLRERQGDVELLAQALLGQFAGDNGGKVKGFSRQALRAMNQYAWPGNVRELINRIRQGVIMAEHPYLTPEDLGMERRAADVGRPTLDDARARAEIEAIRAALRRCQHNVSEAARELGVSRATLYRLLERYALSGHLKGKATPERSPSPATLAAVDKPTHPTQPTSLPDAH